MKYIIPLRVRVDNQNRDAVNFLLEPSCAFLSGAAGSGKSTTLKTIADVLGDKSCSYIALRHLQRFHPSLQDTLALSDQNGHNFSQVANEQGERAHCIILDGIDELLLDARREFLAVLPDWIAKCGNCRWIVSSRPIVDLEIPDGFKKAELLAPSENAVKQILDESGIRMSEVERLIASGSSKAVLTNPLLLSILIDIVAVHGHFPERISDLYNGFIASHLSDWDLQRDIVRSSKLSRHQLKDALEDIALHFFSESNRTVSISDLINLLSHRFGIAPAQAKEIILDSRFTWVLSRDGDELSFVHKSLQEFLAAKAILRSGTSTQILGRTRPSVEFIGFLIEIASDPEKIADILIEQGHFANLLNALERTGDSLGRLKSHVIYQVAKEAQSLGSNKIMIGEHLEFTNPRVKDLGAILDETDIQTKGHAFERYMASLLKDEFQIVSLNRLTPFGEFDIICSPRALDHFWLRYPSDFFVECKNLQSKSPVSQMNEFIGKASAVGAKLGFFVSMSGFTESALNSARQTWTNTGVPSVVCISLGDLKDYSRSEKSTKVFLQDLCRLFQFGI